LPQHCGVSTAHHFTSGEALSLVVVCLDPAESKNEKMLASAVPSPQCTAHDNRLRTVIAFGARRYILVYPQGCDVCNHLSLFLCVADYDKLLPGWSHFAQFTIAVVNQDPKKSKYSGEARLFVV